MIISVCGTVDVMNLFRQGWRFWLVCVWLGLAGTVTLVSAQTNVPVLVSLAPNSTQAGGPGFTLTVNGSNFDSRTDVHWNGSPRLTTFVSLNQITAQITAADIAVPGVITITAFKPIAGGGTSNPLIFTITSPATPVPVITSLSPNAANAGGPPFTLMVMGRGFVSNSVVRWNGADRPTNFISNTQLTAQIFSGDLPAAGTATVTVFNPSVAGAGGGLSNAVPFTINVPPLPAPVLNTVTANVIGQGARQVRLTLVGANFRPGVRVVIGQNAANTALMPAADIAVESVQRLNDTTLFVVVTAAPQAALNPRAVDVINTDNTNTGARGSNTTKPLNIQAGTSLGAPLQITNLLIVHPRTGTVISQGERLFAEAVLSGAGTGTVIGQWLWDGQITEQFAVQFIGGERATLKTQNPLPTAFLGQHQLSLKITSPNSIQTPPVTVIVNNGSWKMLRLVEPTVGRAFKTNAPPHLRWTLVPGAAKYQVAFSSQPYFNSLTQWHDVTAANEWQVPATVWSMLPEGELFWTVRVIEAAGNQRTPAPLRRIMHFNPNALEPLAPAPEPNAPVSATMLAWEPVRMAVIYRVTVSSDVLGKLVIRRFATANSKIDVKALADKFQEGTLYFWRVEAYSLKGRLLMQSAPQNFVPRPARSLEERDGDAAKVTNNVSIVGLSGHDLPARAAAKQNLRETPRDLIASLTLPPARDEVVSPVQAATNQLAANLAARTPAPEAVVTTNRPSISISFKTAIKPADITLLIDDTDFTQFVQSTPLKLDFAPQIPLSNGTHQITLSYGGESLAWTFTVNAAVTTSETDAATAGTDAEKEVDATATANAEQTAAADAAAQAQATAEPNATTPVPVVEKEFTWESGSNTQTVSGSEADTNALTLATQGRYKNGAWLTEMNGNGLLNTALSPRPRHSLGQFNDYQFHVARELPASQWGADLRFGMVAPQLYLNSEYTNTGFAREGLEAGLRTPVGRFGFYRNTNDKGQGEGTAFGYHQQVFGGSYDLPTFFKKEPDRMQFRLMWLSARDVDGNPLKTIFDEEGKPQTVIDEFATPRVGDSYGALLSYKLNPQWTWLSEYTITSNNVNRLKLEGRQFGRAWRTGVQGTWKKTNINLAFRDVSPRYATPASANFTLLGQSDRRGLDLALSRETKTYGGFTANYQYLQSDFRYAERAHIGLHNVTLGWNKTLTQTTTENMTRTTTLSFSVNEARTTTANRQVPGITGLADQRRDGVNVTLTESIQTQIMGTLNISVGGSRNWFRDNVNDRANNIITSLNSSLTWNPTTWLNWQSNISMNWTAGERFSAGGSRNLSIYVQPALTWSRTGLSLIPLITVNRMASSMLLAESKALMMTGDMWTTNYGGRIAWQLPGRFRFNVFSFEGSQARMRDGLTNTTMRTPRLMVLWTLVQPTKPAPQPEPKASAEATPKG